MGGAIVNDESSEVTFLGDPPSSEAAQSEYDASRQSSGFLYNYMRVWAWRPDLSAAFRALREQVGADSALTPDDLAVIVTATVSKLGDSYCSLAWGAKLAGLSDDETSAQVIAGGAAPALSARGRALATWARQVAADPNATTPAQVAALREAGLGDREIFEATALIAFRLAFSTVNDALGVVPDRQVADAAPPLVRAAVSYGRAPAQVPSPR
jgi:uncharacterized peroxidase-related enzyme